MKIFLQKNFIFTLATACLFTFSGCQSTAYERARDCAAGITLQGVCKSSADQQAESDSSVPVSPSPSPVVTPEEISQNVESRVYLDSSESIRGFAAASGENNQFIKLLGTIGYAMPGCRLFKYGGAKRKDSSSPAPVNNIENILSGIRFSKDFENPSFYNLDSNPDDILFNHLANEKENVRSVLITDGVYSSPNAELQSETVKAIENWIKRGRFFGILVFDSPFKGKLWSENKRSWIENIDVEKRPFYAFVFSPDEKGFVELRDKIMGEFPNTNVLAFPRQAARCDLEPKTKLSIDQSEEFPDSPFNLYEYTSEIFNENNSAELFYDLRCQPAAAYPVEKFTPEITLEHYSWENGNFKKNEKPPLFHVEYNSAIGTKAKPSPASTVTEEKSETAPSPAQPAVDQGNLKISFNKETTSTYSFYQLVFSLSADNQSFQKIRGISTQDDGVAENAGKTYRFYEFISALTTVHLQNKETIKLPAPTFVVLNNK